MRYVSKYLFNLLLLSDLALNTIFGGSPTETCSSRLGRHYNTNKVAHIIADVLNWIVYNVFGQKNHCQVEIQDEVFYKDDEVLK